MHHISGQTLLLINYINMRQLRLIRKIMIKKHFNESVAHSIHSLLFYVPVWFPNVSNSCPIISKSISNLSLSKSKAPKEVSVKILLEILHTFWDSLPSNSPVARGKEGTRRRDGMVMLWFSMYLNDQSHRVTEYHSLPNHIANLWSDAKIILFSRRILLKSFDRNSHLVCCVLCSVKNDTKEEPLKSYPVRLLDQGDKNVTWMASNSHAMWQHTAWRVSTCQFFVEFHTSWIVITRHEDIVNE